MQREKIINDNEVTNDYQKQYEFIKDTLTSFKKLFNQLTTIQKREYLRLVISRIEWNGEQADIFLYGTTPQNNKK